MQSVERKKKKGRKHGRLTALVLCVLLLAVSATAAILLRKEGTKAPEPAREPVTGAITQRSTEDVRSITITRRGEAPYTLVRGENGDLCMEQGGGPEWTADEAVAELLLDTAANLTYEDVFTERREDWEPEEESFGLKDPLIAAVFRYTDGTEITARVGDSADPDNNACYYLVVDGDDRLYALNAGTVQDLSVEKAVLRPVHQLQIHSALLDRITVKDGTGTIQMEWALQGKISDQDAAENWKVTVPFVYPADYDAVQNMKDNAENLRLGTYICSADETDNAAYGLDHPSAEIEMHMAAGSTGTVSDYGVYDVTDWEERTVRLKVGNRKSDMVDYVQYEGDIYTMTHFTLSVFTEAQPLSTAARYPAATPLNSLESLLIEKQGEESVRYALVRLRQAGEAADGTAEDEDGQIRCMRNGEEIDYDAFAAAYERLLTVTVSGKLPNSYVCKNTHTKYTFHTVSGGTHTVELSDYDGIHDAVTMDGHTLFYLIGNGMTDLP